MITEPAPTSPTRAPIAVYQMLRQKGLLQPDPAQQPAIVGLQSLYRTLLEYRPEGGLRGWLARLGLTENGGVHAPMGLYLYGPVGRGKSMLMDLFFAAVPGLRKRRVHFHAFMLEVHDRIEHERRAKSDAPILKVASDIASEVTLLCFDEFQVDDIADAMILGRLFQALFERGVVVVATSNIAPDDLFKGQPGRDAFLPFIALIKQRLDLVMMDAGRDFRRERLRGMRTWLVPADARADHELDRAFAELTGGVEGMAVPLWVMGRSFVVPLAAEGVARCDFDLLCGTALGAGDYLALAHRFHTLILDGIPRLSPDNYDKARRFIVLIDTLYDHRVKLLASAAAMPDQLYQRGKNARMFERTASRLDEMQSQDWLELPHLP